MADETLDQRLDRIEAVITTLANEMAAMRADIAGTAKNVTITALQRFIERESRTVHADFRLLTGLVSSVATTVQALLDHQAQLADRVAALEHPEA